MAEPMIGRLALIGVGLIGSSIARSARRGGLAGEIVGCARRPETRARCLELGLVDAMHEDPAAAVEGADLVIMALHLGFYEEVAKRIAPALKPGAIVSDVGSVKANVFRDVAPHLPAGVHLVPGHPVSGTEKSGPDAGFAELFDDRWCILTPADDADPAAARTTLGLGTAAVQNGDWYPHRSNNLSDLSDAAAARTNIDVDQAGTALALAIALG